MLGTNPARIADLIASLDNQCRYRILETQKIKTVSTKQRYLP